jgi:hypothetical protein
MKGNSGFGESKKQRALASRQGVVLREGRKRWCGMKNPPVQLDLSIHCILF